MSQSRGPGRPKSDNPRCHRIQVNLTDDEYDGVMRLRESLGGCDRSLSSVIRQALSLVDEAICEVDLC